MARHLLRASCFRNGVRCANLLDIKRYSAVLRIKLFSLPPPRGDENKLGGDNESYYYCPTNRARKTEIPPNYCKTRHCLYVPVTSRNVVVEGEEGQDALPAAFRGQKVSFHHLERATSSASTVLEGGKSRFSTANTLTREHLTSFSSCVPCVIRRFTTVGSIRRRISRA